MIIKSNARRSGAGAFASIHGYLHQDGKEAWSMRSDELFGSHTAAAEMRGVAAHAPRCEKPALHLSIAWAPEDTPTQQQVGDVVHRILAECDLHDHQWEAVAHKDSPFFHVHLLANLVHPRTYKVKPLSKIFPLLMVLARTLEVEFGWRAPAALADALFNPATMRGLAEKPTFGRWARTVVAPIIEDVLSDRTTTWDTFHRELAARGVRYAPTMRGGVIEDGWDPHYRVRASRVHTDLSRERLEKRLGAYEEPLDDVVSMRSEAYSSVIIEGAAPDRGPEDLRARFVAACAGFAESRNTPEEVAIKRADVRSGRVLRQNRTQSDLRALEGLPPWVRAVAAASRMLVAHRDAHVYELEVARQRRAERMSRSTLRWRSWLIESARGGDVQAADYLRRNGVRVTPMVEKPAMREKRLSIAV